MNYFLHLIQTDANAANVIATIASAIMAALALIVSIVSVIVSVWNLKIQRHHNVLSVCPLPEVTVADYENSLRVKIRNNGSGPLLIKEMKVTNGNESHAELSSGCQLFPESVIGMIIPNELRTVASYLATTLFLSNSRRAKKRLTSLPAVTYVVKP
jgi:hypothetical protein